MKNRHHQKLPIVTDVTFDQLRAALSPELEHGLSFQLGLTRRVLAVTGWNEPREESGETAWNSLVEIERELENHAYSIAQDLSNAQWLWYLRRARWLFEDGALASTAPYLAAVAESVGAWSATRGSPPVGPDSGLVGYPVDRGAAIAILRMWAVARLLGGIQSTLRWCGKGAFVRACEDELPEPVPDPELEAAVTLWDKRTEDGTGFLSRAALYTHTLGDVPDNLAGVAATVPVAGRSSVAGHYGLAALHLGETPALLDPALPLTVRWPMPVLDLVTVLWAMFLNHGVVPPGWYGSFRRTGYRVLTRGAVLSELDHAVRLLGDLRLGGAIPSDVSLGPPQQVYERLRDTEALAWPPTTGPVFREAEGDVVFADLHAATQRLSVALSRPAFVGELANVWSEHFERTVQAAIDESCWKPSPAIASLRRRRLKVHGKAITDIDAIGERGDRLLLVSCKGIPFSDAWNRGECRAVLNVAAAADAAVADWRDRMAKLRAEPRGDNYDFSRHSELIGVVVFPLPPWSPTPDTCAEIAPGLRAASSADELGQWVQARYEVSARKLGGG